MGKRRAFLSPERFEALVGRALSSLPQEFRQRLENVAILIEEEPPLDMEPDTMGLYEGIPLAERSLGEPPLPDRIVLFRQPIERACRTPEEVEAEVRQTVLHEVGHFFGLGEAELE